GQRVPVDGKPASGEADEGVGREGNCTAEPNGPQEEHQQQPYEGGPYHASLPHAGRRRMSSPTSPSKSPQARSRPNDIAAPAGQLKRVENSMATNWPSILPDVPPSSIGGT